MSGSSVEYPLHNSVTHQLACARCVDSQIDPTAASNTCDAYSSLSRASHPSFVEFTERFLTLVTVPMATRFGPS